MVNRREERDVVAGKEAGHEEEKKVEVMKFIPKRKLGTKDLVHSI